MYLLLPINVVAGGGADEPAWNGIAVKREA